MITRNSGIVRDCLEANGILARSKVIFIRSGEPSAEDHLLASRQGERENIVSGFVTRGRWGGSKAQRHSRARERKLRERNHYIFHVVENDRITCAKTWFASRINHSGPRRGDEDQIECLRITGDTNLPDTINVSR